MLKKRELNQARVLKLLSEYLTIFNIARLMNKDDKTIYQAFSNYRKKGWINKDRSLTSSGLQITERAFAISQNTEFKSNSIRLHNLMIKVPIPKLDQWINRNRYLTLKDIQSKTIDMGTWKAEQIMIDNIKVWLNPKYLVFYMKDYYAETSLDAFTLALEDLKKLVNKIEQLLKIKVINNNSIDFKVSRQHYALIRNQLAAQYNKEKKKLFVYDDLNRLRLLIDDSLSLKEFEAVDNELSLTDSEKAQNFFKDLLEKKYYKLSDIKDILDKLSKENLILSTNFNLYNKNIEKHLETLGNMNLTLKEIKQETKYRRQPFWKRWFL